MAELDKLIARAQQATVRHEVAAGYVRELDRWAARPAPRRWFGWIAVGAVAAAAAVIALVVVARGPATPSLAAVRIGDRTAIIAERDTVYRVVRATDDETTIAVERGAVTARLWGGGGHRLSLEGGGVQATAIGTVYRLVVDERGAAVQVAEGTVEVRRGEHAERISASGAWPAAHALLALEEPPPPTPVVIDAAVRDAAVADAAVPTDAAAAVTPRPVVDAAPLSIKDRWRQARLLRGQGSFEAAIDECLAIADAHDATWSPIALVEAIRIYDGPLAAPERVIELADRFMREWPSSPLAGEVRRMRCHAQTTVGRPCAP